jgi:hypothetical protein
MESPQQELIEFLGLPGVGKTYTVASKGFNNPINIPLGKSFDKLKNLFTVFWGFNGLVRTIIFLYVLHSMRYFKILKARPYIVLLERVGRFLKYYKGTTIKTTVFDEGVYQFVWRIFSEIPISQNNISEMKSLVHKINTKMYFLSIIYVHTRKEQLVERIILRNKIDSNFDKGVIQTNWKKFELGRLWMSYLISELRKKRVVVDIIWNK